jgi:hypothetical protein
MKSSTRHTSPKSARRTIVRQFAESLAAEGYVMEVSDSCIILDTEVGGVMLTAFTKLPLATLTAAIDLEPKGTPEELLDLLNRLNSESIGVRYFQDTGDTTTVWGEMDVPIYGDGINGVALAEMLESYIFEYETAIDTVHEAGLLGE